MTNKQESIAKNNSDAYCNLVHYSFCNLTPRLPFEIKPDFFNESGCTDDCFDYIEDYENIKLIKDRIFELNREWQQGEIYNHRNLYLMIELINHWGDLIRVGICDDLGLHVTGISGYTLECLNKSKIQKATNKEIQAFDFCVPDSIQSYDCIHTEINSFEIGLAVIKEWLDTGTYIQYFENISGEIETRQYKYIRHKSNINENEIIRYEINKDVKFILTIIPKINKEIIRLQWTKQDKENYLIEQYGNRKYENEKFNEKYSIFLLSNAEILDFLQFLEEQQPKSIFSEQFNLTMEKSNLDNLWDEIPF